MKMLEKTHGGFDDDNKKSNACCFSSFHDKVTKHGRT